MKEVDLNAPKGGRPHSEKLHQAMLKAPLDLVLEVGFRGVSVEGIAAKTGVGEKASKQGEVRQGLDIEAAIDAFYT